MDGRRRGLLLSLALAPLAPPWNPAVASEGQVVALTARGGGTEPASPLRYDTGGGNATLRMPRGRPVRLRLRNGLPGPTSLDLQGVRVPPPLGGAGPLGGLVQPGAEAEIAFTPPDAGTFWFHPWLRPSEPDATAGGLAGVLVVVEDEHPDLEADADWVLTVSHGQAGSPDATPRIDGGFGPRRETLAPGARLRLRIVNASTSQAVTVAVAGAVASVIALDGQPSALFRPRQDQVPLGPGDRVDMMLDMPGVADATVRMEVSGRAARAIEALVVTATGDPVHRREPIAALPANPLLPTAIALESATRASLVATMRDPSTPADGAIWSINGRSGIELATVPLFRAKRGAPVSLTFVNKSRRLVSFRVHGFCLRLLHDLDDGWEPYWREAVPVPPGGTRHAAFVADLPGRWLIESPYFDQAAGGLRTWFEVG